MNSNYNYSIVIVTYDKRYEKNLIPLIKAIRSQSSNIEISLMINGSYEEKFNEAYRKNILNFKDGTNLKQLIRDMFVWAKNEPNREVKKINYEIEECIYEYWKN